MPNMSNSSTPTEENGNKNIAVEQLANGFLNLYENDVIRVKSNLQEMLYGLLSIVPKIRIFLFVINCYLCLQGQTGQNVKGLTRTEP